MVLHVPAGAEEGASLLGFRRSKGGEEGSLASWIFPAAGEREPATGPSMNPGGQLVNVIEADMTRADLVPG